jgi:MFS family permease
LKLMRQQTLPTSPGRSERLATRASFLVAGIATSTWAPIVPYAKMRLGLEADRLGLLLLGLGFGSILAMPISGALAARFGCRVCLILVTGLLGVTLPVLAVAWNIWLFAGTLFLFGAAVGAMDCVMNIQAIIVERAGTYPLMSGFHGFFSLGGLLGTAAMVGLLSIGLSPLAASLWVGVATAIIFIPAAPWFLPYGAEDRAAGFGLPRGIVLAIGLLCFVAFLTEGAALDWSAVFLTEIRHLDPAFGGFGYLAFSLAMVAGRLAGDPLVDRVGRQTIVSGGAFLAAFGLGMVALVPSWQMGLLGYLLLGLGCSNVVPLLYAALGRQTVMPKSAAVPAVSTIAYLGILGGPAAIGLLAHAASLQAAFLLVVFLLVLVGFGGRIIPI